MMLNTIPCLFLLNGLMIAADALPDAAIDVPAAKGVQKAVFAGGCFWCTEAVFEQLAGVNTVVSGYAGGTKESAKYDVVSAGRTDHAEVIEITFDASKITYGQLLKVFFGTAHDPTTLDRQGPDWGKQYRSHIYTIGDDQNRVAKAYIEQLNGAKAFRKPIVTKVDPLKEFHAAEKYHQDFVRVNPGHPYVVVNALPKIEKTRKAFPALVKSKAK